MRKQAMIVLALLLLAACGGSFAATPHPTPNPTVDPTEVKRALAENATITAARETARAEDANMMEATFEAGGNQAQEAIDRDAYDELLTDCIFAPPYPPDTAAATAMSCATQLAPYRSKYATQTALAGTPTPHP
jgi:hypothetical protein